jgi:uncharacterized membrane protein YkvA (DUF1232 family)
MTDVATAVHQKLSALEGRYHLKLTVVSREGEKSPSLIVTDRNTGHDGDLINWTKTARHSSSKWRRQAQRIREEALVFYFAFEHPRVPWYARLVAASTAGYLLSPVQLIPSYIPVIGFLDDFLILFLGVRLLRKIIPRDVLAECRQHAEAVETRRKKEIKSVAARVSAGVIVCLWIFATILSGAMVLKYLFR